MSYDKFNWKHSIATNGKRWSIMCIVGSGCLITAGIATFSSCGIRSVTARPELNADEQTLNVGWLNFDAKPIQDLITKMIPNSVIEIKDGKIIIPAINEYNDFLTFSRENRDTLEVLRDTGVPSTQSDNSIIITPITAGQRKLVDTWVMATNFHAAAAGGIALFSIGFIAILTSFTFLIYIHSHKKLLDKFLSDELAIKE